MAKKNVMLVSDLTKNKKLTVYKAYILDKSSYDPSQVDLLINTGNDRFATDEMQAIGAAIRKLDSIDSNIAINLLNKKLDDIRIALVEMKIANEPDTPLLLIDNEEADPNYHSDTTQVSISLTDKDYAMNVYHYKLKSIDVEADPSTNFLTLNHIELDSVEDDLIDDDDDLEDNEDFEDDDADVEDDE